jgi:hypothetical protein
MVQCKKYLPCAVHYAIIFAFAVRILLLSKRGHIPPFSSYGGILRGPQGRAFFCVRGSGRRLGRPVTGMLLRLALPGWTLTAVQGTLELPAQAS